MAAEKKKDYHVPNLMRALDILELLAKEGRGMTMMEIADHYGFPTNSVFRVTMTLQERGYLERDEDTKRFTLARKLLWLGYASVGEQSLVETALDVMRDLRDETKETVLLGTLVGEDGVILEQVRGLHPFTFNLAPGTPLTLHVAAPAKAILAHMDPKDTAPIIDGMEMPRLTKNTIVTPAAYKKELKRVKAQGYATDMDEYMEGGRCVSAPIFNRRGRPIAAVWFTGPSDRMPKEGIPAMGELVIKHARRISKRLGYMEK